MCKEESLRIIDNYKKSKFGYYANDVRLAHFIWEKYFSLKKIDEAILNFRNSLEFASKFKDNKMGYTVYSNYLLGKIYYDRGDMDQAKEFLKAVLKTSKEIMTLTLDPENF